MMKNFYSIALLLFINSIKAQTSLTEIIILETFDNPKTLKVLRGKFDSRQPEMEKVKTSTDVYITPLRKEGVYQECVWKYGKTKIEGIDSTQIDEITNKYINLYEGIQIRFLVDKNGIFQKITNFKECEKDIDETIDKLHELKEGTREEKNEIKAFMKKSYTDPETMITALFPEFMNYFSFIGESFNKDSIYISKTLLPNLFGGKPFPATITTGIDSISSNVVKVTSKTKLLQNELNEILAESLKELSKSKDQESLEKLPIIDIKTDVALSYDFKKKKITKIISVKNSTVENVQQTQTLIINIDN